MTVQDVSVPSAELAAIAGRLQPAPVDQDIGQIDYIEFRVGGDPYETKGGSPMTYARLQAWAGPGGQHWTRRLREAAGTPVCDQALEDFIDFRDDNPAWFDVPPDDPAALDRFLLTNPFRPLRGDTADLYLLFRISWLAQVHVPTLRQRQTTLRVLARHPGLHVQTGVRDDTGRPAISVSAVGVERDPLYRYASVKPVRRVLTFDAGTGLLLTETLYREPTVLAPGSRTPPPDGSSTILDRVVFVDRQRVTDPAGPTLGCPLHPHPFDR
ncbi:hypothetical protein AB0H83_50535 [Dactylosporangium sp. NPDC050688]|uniref:hypothetical protein n=1 Tax=Dactylosporangium sp. NPDC050688 TaxID=3157217 RepID=UPI0033F1C7C6